MIQERELVKTNGKKQKLSFKKWKSIYHTQKTTNVGPATFFLLIEQLTTGLTPIREDNIKTRDYSVTKVTWD